jgi:hypothetical protein
MSAPYLHIFDLEVNNQPRERLNDGILPGRDVDFRGMAARM